MKQHTCYFKLFGQEGSVTAYTGVDTFADGFWIDSEWQLVRPDDEDRKFWIPPRAIDYIKYHEAGGI